MKLRREFDLSRLTLLKQLYQYSNLADERRYLRDRPVDFANGGTNFRRFASYSNSGNSLVFIAAPGGDFTLFPNGDWFKDMVRRTNQNNTDDGFAWADGTSMAARAAGVAALIKQRFPNISVGAWKNKLANTADDEGKVGHDKKYGRGFVNAYRACTQ